MPIQIEGALIPVVVDFETYWDKDYSLTKMSTSEYVLDPRFEVLGLSVKLGDNEPVYVSGPDKARELLHHPVMERHINNGVVVAHHAQFDGAILEWIYGLRPFRYFCTMSAGRQLEGRGSLDWLSGKLNMGTKGDALYRTEGRRFADLGYSDRSALSGYANMDAELTWRLWNMCVKRCSNMDAIIIDSVVKMFTRPVMTLSKGKLEKEVESSVGGTEELAKDLADVLGGPWTAS